MKKLRLSVAMVALAAAGTLAGCSGTAASPDVSGRIRKSLDQARFKDVSVSEDREKGIVTLGGVFVGIPSIWRRHNAESFRSKTDKASE